MPARRTEYDFEQNGFRVSFHEYGTWRSYSIEKDGKIIAHSTRYNDVLEGAYPFDALVEDAREHIKKLQD